MSDQDTLKNIQFDEQGFLVNLDDWSRDIAAAIALQEGLTL
ncbi:TusE/DsrC/DsvC family sulfur relay protein, partial [Oleiphilus sp. HI0043]